MKLNKPFAALYIEDIASDAIDEAALESAAFELAMDLIGRSVCERTGGHVQSIEVLLGRAALVDDPARRFLDEAWPHIRARLSAYPAGHDSRA